MKYIRTKDGIIDLSKVTIGENGWKNIEEYIAFKQEEQRKSIKDADAIEDLCDEFVMFCPITDIHHFSKYETWYEIQTIAREHNDIYVYGAIWTDKGLIYVAKMNDKGELELL